MAAGDKSIVLTDKNVKTINGTSVLGSGDITIEGLNVGDVVFSTKTHPRSFKCPIGLPSNTIYSIAYGNGLYVISHASSGVAVSSDLVNWTIVSMVGVFGTNASLSITFCENIGKFVAQHVANYDIATSTDGVTWTITNTTPAYPFVLKYVKKHNKVYGISSNTSVWTTDGGTTFNSINSNTPNTLYDFVYASDRDMLVAVGASNTIRYAYGPNITTLSSGGISGLVPGAVISSVAYGNGMFAAVTNVSHSNLIKSYDGISWVVDIVLNTTVGLSGICFLDGWFFVVDNKGILYKSTDCDVWTPIYDRLLNFSTSNKLVVANNAIFTLDGTANLVRFYSNSHNTDRDKVCVLDGSFEDTTNAPSLRNYYQKDTEKYTVGRLWEASKTDIIYLKGAVTANDKTIVVGNSGSVLSVNNDRFITKETTGIHSSVTLEDVTYGNDIFITVGTSGTIFKNSSGLGPWTGISPGIFGTYSLLTCCYGNNMFLVGGGNGYIAKSDNTPDSSTWSLVTSGFGTSSVYSITFNGSLFVAVGAAGKISTSTDGTVWTARTSGTPSQLNSVCFGNGLFVAVGLSGAIRTSPDGITWTSRTSNFGVDSIECVIYNSTKNVFIASGTAGKVIVSSDGITWTSVSTGVTDAILTLSVVGEYWVGGTNNYKLLFGNVNDTHITKLPDLTYSSVFAYTLKG